MQMHEKKANFLYRRKAESVVFSRSKRSRQFHGKADGLLLERITPAAEKNQRKNVRFASIVTRCRAFRKMLRIPAMRRGRYPGFISRYPASLFNCLARLRFCHAIAMRHDPVPHFFLLTRACSSCPDACETRGVIRSPALSVL